jgi:hypothetical protein
MSVAFDDVTSMVHWSLSISKNVSCMFCIQVNKTNHWLEVHAILRFCKWISFLYSWSPSHSLPPHLHSHTDFPVSRNLIGILFKSRAISNVLISMVNNWIIYMDWPAWLGQPENGTYWKGLHKEMPCNGFWFFNFDLEFLKGAQSFKVLTAHMYLITNGLTGQ